MSAWALHAKRKEPEEAVVELLRNVSLSPPKRMRVADSWISTNSWPMPSFQPQLEAQPAPPQVDPLNFFQALESPLPSPSPPPPVATAVPASATDEKAIVLYKPVNPPLFPGGPPTGSPEPPFIVDATGALAACKGTDNNGSSVDTGHASSAFANSSSTWTDLFEALDLHGKKPSLPIRRLQRTSSCSSLPRVSYSMNDTSMEETDTQLSSSQLALIPYSPPAFLVPAANYTHQSLPNSEAVLSGADPSEEMADDDAMDVMEDTLHGDGVATESGTEFGSPIPTFGMSLWEPCDVFQPPCSQVMWSH
ncbi:uncharacterized protein [Physcomitrium patens]|uniref:Uncharacterized protein n=1 Tax=Physcomitrium patens TaxID=3218 RepID=A0A2K1J063_PHYPA|nr:pollen-specific leucine-rich repeat extensin-like protein 2 isoform X1 [Physcomitrium patens]PNR34922.1 hypothetical protein PHYPA_022821 [Physcomitrium patens]|eukprot:XP_024403008.1 pollen-specific leucine-rich repeat extensin-like protein 2 isoform X1 [Physcomitrella patens]